MTTTGRIGRIALGDMIGRTARTCSDVRILDRLPMTATGKVQKHALRAEHGEIFAKSIV